MFGKRGGAEAAVDPLRAPPPAPVAGPAVATRPQKIESTPAAPAEKPRSPAAERLVDAVGSSRTGPRHTPGFEQLRKAQAPAVAEVVREQREY